MMTTNINLDQPRLDSSSIKTKTNINITAVAPIPIDIINRDHILRSEALYKRPDPNVYAGRKLVDIDDYELDKKMDYNGYLCGEPPSAVMNAFGFMTLNHAGFHRVYINKALELAKKSLDKYTKSPLKYVLSPQGAYTLDYDEQDDATKISRLIRTKKNGIFIDLTQDDLTESSDSDCDSECESCGHNSKRKICKFCVLLLLPVCTQCQLFSFHNTKGKCVCCKHNTYHDKYQAEIFYRHWYYVRVMPNLLRDIDRRARQITICKLPGGEEEISSEDDDNFEPPINYMPPNINNLHQPNSNLPQPPPKIIGVIPAPQIIKPTPVNPLTVTQFITKKSAPNTSAQDKFLFINEGKSDNTIKCTECNYQNKSKAKMSEHVVNRHPGVAKKFSSFDSYLNYSRSSESNVSPKTKSDNVKNKRQKTNKWKPIQNQINNHPVGENLDRRVSDFTRSENLRLNKAGLCDPTIVTIPTVIPTMLSSPFIPINENNSYPDTKFFDSIPNAQSVILIPPPNNPPPNDPPGGDPPIPPPFGDDPDHHEDSVHFYRQQIQSLIGLTWKSVLKKEYLDLSFTKINVHRFVGTSYYITIEDIIEKPIHDLRNVNEKTFAIVARDPLLIQYRISRCKNRLFRYSKFKDIVAFASLELLAKLIHSSVTNLQSDIDSVLVKMAAQANNTAKINIDRLSPVFEFSNIANDTYVLAQHYYVKMRRERQDFYVKGLDVDFQKQLCSVTSLKLQSFLSLKTLKILSALIALYLMIKCSQTLLQRALVLLSEVQHIAKAIIMTPFQLLHQWLNVLEQLRLKFPLKDSDQFETIQRTLFEKCSNQFRLTLHSISTPGWQMPLTLLRGRNSCHNLMQTSWHTQSISVMRQLMLSSKRNSTTLINVPGAFTVGQTVLKSMWDQSLRQYKISSLHIQLSSRKSLSQIDLNTLDLLLKNAKDTSTPETLLPMSLISLSKCFIWLSLKCISISLHSIKNHLTS